MNMREEFVQHYFKLLGCDPKDGPWPAIIKLIKSKNIYTATAWMFELSWREDKDYLRRASDSLKQTLAQVPENTELTAGDLYEWMQTYIATVEKLPR